MICADPSNIEMLYGLLFSHFKAEVVIMFDKSRLIDSSIHVVHYSGGGKFFGGDS